jgi:hypothetical protein
MAVCIAGAAMSVGIIFVASRPRTITATNKAEQSGDTSAPQAEELDAPTGEAIADPVLREARAQVDEVLADLLAGKLDQDEKVAPVARKLKGYQSWSIKSQQLVQDGAADFRGVLTAPGARASFDIHFVKQGSGKWAIGTFGGPIEENPR